ncbi:hypothetical protein GCM10009792_03000 [Microcella alkalica]
MFPAPPTCFVSSFDEALVAGAITVLAIAALVTVIGLAPRHRAAALAAGVIATACITVTLAVARLVLPGSLGGWPADRPIPRARSYAAAAPIEVASMIV